MVTGSVTLSSSCVRASLSPSVSVGMPGWRLADVKRGGLDLPMPLDGMGARDLSGVVNAATNLISR